MYVASDIINLLPASQNSLSLPYLSRVLVNGAAFVGLHVQVLVVEWGGGGNPGDGIDPAGSIGSFAELLGDEHIRL